MILAHLRGVKIETGYPNGVTSILRERTLLQALDLEQQSQLGIQRLMMEAAFSPIYNERGAKTIFKDAHKSWQRYYHMSEFLNKAPVMVVPADERGLALGKMYEALEKSGLFDQIKAETDQFEQDLRNG